MGGDSAIEFNGDCRQKDMINDFGRNVWCLDDSTLEDMMDAGVYHIDTLVSDESMQKQEVLNNCTQALDGFGSTIDGVGSSFVPDEDAVKTYDENKEAE